jgi:hypothetical protein
MSCLLGTRLQRCCCGKGGILPGKAVTAGLHQLAAGWLTYVCVTSDWQWLCVSLNPCFYRLHGSSCQPTALHSGDAAVRA